MTLYSRDERRLAEIKDAIDEARRFVNAAEIAYLALSKEDERFHHSISFAAAKRASMDLTRALTKIRKSRFA